MAGKAFNLAANLTINTINLGVVAKRIENRIGQIKQSINIGINAPGLTTLTTKLANLKKFASGTKIDIKVSGATKVQIANIRSLGRALEKYGPAISHFRSRNISLIVKAPTAAAIKNLGTLGKKLAALNPVLDSTTSRNVLINVRAPTAKTIDNINRAGVALVKIKPILDAMGAGANIGIRVTGLGSKRMESFANSLTKIQANIGKATPALHNLNTILQSKINHLNQFKLAATNAGNAITALGASTAKVKSSTNATAAATKNLATQTHAASSFMYELGKSGFLAVKRFSAFMIGTTVIFGFLRSVTDAFREFVEFEKQLARIAQVTGSKSIAGVKGMADEVTRLSISMGVASKDLLGVTQTFAQAGLRGYELQKALETIAATDLSPTFTDMNNTGEGLIAMMGQFKIKADEFKDVFGSINAVSAQYAVESDDLITAIRTVGGVFSKSSNESKGGVKQLQELLAIFTSIRSSTRESAETISTGLRTIFTRIQRPKTIEFLKAFGIELADSEGNFIGAYEASQKLSKGIENLGLQSLSYKRIQEELGGYRQVGKVIPLLSEYAKKEEALKVAIGGTNSLEEQSGIQLATLSRRIVQVAEDFKRLVREIAGTSSFAMVVDAILGMANAFIKLAEAIKPVLPMLLGLMAFKGGLGAVQFVRGAMSQLPQQSAVIGAGAAAARGGISGAVSGAVGGLAAYGRHVKGQYQAAGYFQNPVIPGPGTASVASNILARQAAAQVFPGATGVQGRFLPQIQALVAPAAQNLARVFGTNTREFNVAMNAINKELVKYKRQIYRGGALPSSTYLNMIGYGAARSDSKFKMLRGIGTTGRLFGSALTNNPMLTMMGGMAAQSYIPGATGGIVGKTLMGAGIGGMIGSAFGPGPGTAIGAAAGAVLAGVSSIVDALGPDKIKAANENVAKSLEEFGKTLVDFDGDISATGVMANISTEIRKSTDEYFKSIRGMSLLGDEGFWGSFVDGVKSLFTAGGTRESPEVQKRYNVRMDQISQDFTKSVVPIAKQYSDESLAKMFRDYGDITKDPSKLKAAVPDFNFDDFYTAIAFSGPDKKSKELADKLALIELEPRLITKGKPSGYSGSWYTPPTRDVIESDKDYNARIEEKRMMAYREYGEVVLGLRKPAIDAASSLMDLTFTLDLFKLTLDDLKDVLTRVSNENQRLSSTTDQYYDRALSGPSSTKIISAQRINPFSAPGAYTDQEIAPYLNDLGLSGSDIALKFSNALGIRRLLPQIINSARGQNLGEADIRGSLIEKTIGRASLETGGKYVGGMFNTYSDEEKERLKNEIDSYFEKEGSPLKIPKEGAYKIVDKIYGDIFKQSAEVLAEQTDLVNKSLERFTEIIGKNLEIWQKVRADSLQILDMRQGFQERRANLFNQESLGTQYTRLSTNRQQQMDLMVKGGTPENMRNALFGPGGLIAKRQNLENSIKTPFITDEKVKELSVELGGVQNEINKWVDVAKIGVDVEKQLVNVEQQILQEQRKREAGKNLMGDLARMDPFQRIGFMKNLGNVVKIAAGKKLSSNKEYADTFDVLDRIKNYAGTPEELKRVENLTDKANFNYAQATKATGVLPQVDILGTPSGESAKDKRLAAEFDKIIKVSDGFAQALFDLTRAQEEAARKIGAIEVKNVSQQIEWARVKITQATVIMEAPNARAAEDNVEGLEPHAKGGKLKGTGPIPILAHGGELIVPKGNVDRGMGGVVEFAKKMGIQSFAQGGIVSYDERQKQKKAAYEKMMEDRRKKYWGRRIATKTSRRQYYLRKLAEKPQNQQATAEDNPLLNDYFANLTTKPSGFTVIGKYERGSITPEMQALKDANLAKRQGRSQPIGDMLGVNVPLIGNVRRGGTNDKLFDDSKLRYASDYDFRKDEDVKREAERIWQEDRTKLTSRQTTSAGYSYQGALQEAVNRKRDSLAFNDFDSSLRSFNEAGSYSFTREQIRELDLNKIGETMIEYEKEFGKNTLLSNLYNLHQKLNRASMKASWSDLQRQGFQRGTERTKTNLAQYRQEGEELARMKVLGQHAWTVLNSGVLDDNDSQRLSNLLTKGKAGLPELRIRQREIENIIGGANRTRGQLPNLFPKFAQGTPMVTKSGLAEIHKGEAIVPAKAVSPKNNQAIQAKSAIDEALIKAANALSNINIPERIVLEFGAPIQHQVTFNNGDILSEKISKMIAEKVNYMIQRQISKVISPVDGSILIG